MKRIALYIIALGWIVAGCRNTGDDLVSYGQNDAHAFAEANSTFAGEFKAFWHAMNENYGIWDFEAQKGVNWDQVYTTYLPQFEALDDTTRQKKVTDAELEDLYSAFLDSLHDGHLYLEIKNLHTGKYIEILPSQARNLNEREHFLEEKYNITNLDFYRTLTKDDLYFADEYDATSSSLIMAEEMDSVCSRLVRAGNAYIAMVDMDGGPDQSNDSIYAAVKRLLTQCQTILDGLKAANGNADKIIAQVPAYNKMCDDYDLLGAQLDVNMPLIDEKLPNDNLKFVTKALFKGGIAYLRFGGFGLSDYMGQPAPADTTSLLYAYYQAVHRVWEGWFETIQVLAADNKLGGVIIDVRNNGGGNVSDYPYVLGALLPSGGYQSHYLRLKEGIGRLDFAPIVPFSLPTYEKQHAVIKDQPIVILTNTHSVSMSEVTTWGVKSQPNGYVIGTRTWGGLSALADDPVFYSESYSGGFGVAKVTPFYGYVPRFVSLFGDKQEILESIGIAPDKEVILDVSGWKNQKRDNQLEAALDYIQSK